MGRYVILLIAPVVIGVVIAAGIAVLSALRQRERRMEARRTALEEESQDSVLAGTDSSATEPPSDLTHRRIAS
jgi:hypothetical protein